MLGCIFWSGSRFYGFMFGRIITSHKVMGVISKINLYASSNFICISILSYELCTEIQVFF